MKQLFVLLAVFILFNSTSFAGKTILGFTENKGQEKDPVFFKLAGSDQNVYVTSKGLAYVFTRSESRSTDDERDINRIVEYSKLEMELLGANIRKENISTENMLPGYNNYYYAHCPDGILFVRTWKKITISSVYPGIDWVLQVNEKGMEHDFIIHPGADPAMIKLVYNGAQSLMALADSSKLKVTTQHGTLFEGDLKTYAQQSGKLVNSKFKVKGNTVTFALGKHKHDETIVIDPPLAWTAPQSSSGIAQAYAVSAARDNSGDAVIAGYTDASGYPTLNAYQGTFASDEDIVVTRLNENGTVLWSTYYGGNHYEEGRGVTTDNNGNVYVTGFTHSFDFPMLNNAQVQYANGYEVAIMKFNSAGVRQWATLYGGTGYDYGYAIEVDNAGNAYITGYTVSTNFPVVNPIQATSNGANDLIIMKMSTTGSVIWATYFGGDDDDIGRGVALDSSGTFLHVTGSSISGTFPTTAGVFQQWNANGYYSNDAFILKMDAATQAVQWATYSGGSEQDFGQGIAVDNSGNIYITGYTASPNLPIVNPGGCYIDSTLDTLQTPDAYIMQCNSTGTQRLWSTYFGGTGVDMAFGIEHAPGLGTFITGRSASMDLPTQPPADTTYFQGVQGDAATYSDMFIAWFKSNNALSWSTYYGNGDNEEGYSIDTDVYGNIFVAGIDSNSVQVIRFGLNDDTGINEPGTTSNITIYPHPVHDILNTTIDIQGEQQVKVNIINMQGQVVKSISQQLTNGPNALRINVEGIAAGIYVLEIQHSKETIKQKFIKQ